jgi:hypothetical protein
VDEQRDLDAELRELVERMNAETAAQQARHAAPPPSAESLREVKREARARRRATPEARRGRRIRRTSGVVVVALALTGGVVYAQGHGLLPSPTSPIAAADPTTSAAATPEASGDLTTPSAHAVSSTPQAHSSASAVPRPAPGQQWPTPGIGEASKPLGRPAKIAHPSMSYRFLALQKGSQHTPVAWDPCRPIHWTVNTAGMPSQGITMVRQAFRALSTATGLRFVYDGTTTERSNFNRELFQPKRYGNRWARVLVEWLTPRQQPDFIGDAIGKGGPEGMYIVGSPEVFVSGEVEFDATWMRQTLANGQHATAEAVILHELGHLAGLGHVTDQSQLMYARETPGITHYGAGDLTGLARLGTGICEPRL